MRSTATIAPARSALLLVGLLLCATATAAGCSTWTGARGEPRPISEQLWREYRTLPAERALAVAGDPKRKWVAGLVGGQPSAREAEEAALLSCQQRRLARRLQAPCRLYAVGDEIVWVEW